MSLYSVVVYNKRTQQQDHFVIIPQQLIQWQNSDDIELIEINAITPWSGENEDGEYYDDPE
ncbi:hypothetical protein [Caviibacterium pharyngocola]|uniref:Uncharacterized protein n=1 Tax=Caviibacterium pharyngocola TaxID=28159 RepID=A0A2M8RV82_9PAST|nr:hypothetical protein [Caviibacterium pharyngocola]PJG82797.1 hypothetical protein CVP04_07490 [Caviibacterium pharyngocola]